jgi:hypothetical protein
MGGVTIRTGPSSIRLIYAFALEPGRRDVLAELRQRAGDLGWQDRRILDDYVLPHLADHINVDEGQDGATEVGHWWRFDRALPARWTLRVNASREVDFRLESVELLYFRTGIGMLLLEIDPDSERLEDWQDVLHLTRFYQLPDDEGGRRVFARRAARLTPSTDDGVSAAWSERLAPRRPGGFGPLIHHLLTDVFGDSAWKRASVPGLLSPFSAFFIDCEGVAEEVRFEARYRWRRQLSSTAVVAAVEDDLHAQLRPYADDMWLAYSSEGGGFFAADAPRTHFFDHELPDHLRLPYTLGYLLALHQRLALGRFSERIARVVASSRGRWTPDQPPRDEIALLQDDFLEYLTRCHFAQVFRTTNHHTSHRTWQEALEVPAFVQEVKLQLRHLYERTITADRIIDEKRRTGLSGRVNAALLGITLPMVVLAILAVAYPGGLGLALAIGVTAGAALVGTATGWLTATYIPVSGFRSRR